MKIVGIGGGTGLPVLLSGLKELNSDGEAVEVTAIVTVADSGGSTGALRDAFDMPAMGDIRKCMISLASEKSVLTSVCSHRFANPDAFAGHSLGNLILSALYEISGSFAGAVEQACGLLDLKGRVLPATESPVTLCALYEDGGIARGEARIPQPGRRIQHVWLETASVGGAASALPVRPVAAPGVLEALTGADAIVLGPGSLYTSIIPNLLVDGVVDAIQSSNAIRICVSNLMTQAGETEGYSAAEHIRMLHDYVSPIDVCVLNSTTIGTAVADRYSMSGAQIVSCAPEDQDELRRLGVIPVAAPLLKSTELKARHDSLTLAKLVVALARGMVGTREVICSQQNGR